MKVAIYCRLSEEDRNKKSENDDSESIQNQKNMLIQYAVDRDWQIYDIYNDDDYAGADRNRPQFRRLLEDAEQRKFDIILCKTQNRFTRELELVEKYIHGLFIEWKIRFVSIVDNADTDIEGNKKSRQINGLVNEWFIEDLSKNIKSVLTNKRQNGKYIGSTALYGYKKDPDEKGHLIIDEEAANVVREVFTLYNQGHGKTAIARLLNNKGIPNPTQYKVTKGIMYKTPSNKIGTLWKYFSISDILVNPMYIGHMVQGRYESISYKTKQNKPIPKEDWIIVENTHEPIIDIDLWNSVQRKVNNNFKPFTNGKIGLFAKKVKCMNCNYIMKSSRTRGERYLRCSTRHIAKDTCLGAFIAEKTLTKVVLKELNSLITNYLNVEEFEDNIILNESDDIKKEKLENEIFTYQKKIEEYSNGIRDLYLDKTKGIITENDFVLFSKDFYESRERTESLLKEAQDELSLLLGKNDSEDNKKEVLEKYINVEELTREMVENLIDYIFVGNKDPTTKQRPIEIHWKL